MNIEVAVVVVAVVAGASTLMVFDRRTAQRVRRWPTGLFPLPKAVWLMWVLAAAFVFAWVLIRGH